MTKDESTKIGKPGVRAPLIKAEQLDKVREYLLGMKAPVKTVFNTQEALGNLADIIKGKLKLGFTKNEIIDAFHINGVEITQGQFNKAWSKISPKRKGNKVKDQTKSNQEDKDGKKDDETV